MNNTQQQFTKKFLRFRYAAIKRYGERVWTAKCGTIEFNPNYTVSCGICEHGHFGDDTDRPYIVELSNGTKFLCFIHDFGSMVSEDVLSPEGEEANNLAAESNYYAVKSQLKYLN
jgi:hypothetical protein